MCVLSHPLTCCLMYMYMYMYSSLTLSVINCQGMNSTLVQGCDSMNYNGYVFPPYLFQLMLGDNNLKGKEPMEHIVSVCPHIEILSLVGNKFESVDDMTPLVCYIVIHSCILGMTHYYFGGRGRGMPAV